MTTPILDWHSRGFECELRAQVQMRLFTLSGISPPGRRRHRRCAMQTARERSDVAIWMDDSRIANLWDCIELVRSKLEEDGATQDEARKPEGARWRQPNPGAERGE